MAEQPTYGSVDETRAREDLIIDVGMHKGEDSEFYLAKGFNVVAIEADPQLAETAQARLSSAANGGRLKVLNVAIGHQNGIARFAKSENSLYGSLSKDFVQRNKDAGLNHEYVDIACVRFEDILREHGIPYYLKIDIEGMDMLCVRALHAFKERPRFISVESNVTALDATFDRSFDELAELWTLGYRCFKYIDQRFNMRQVCPRPPKEGTYVDFKFNWHSSGPFGEETPGSWLNIEQAFVESARLRWRHRLGGLGGKYSRYPHGLLYRALRKAVGRSAGWYDLHAKL
jgi:FkbM family methyltransferase